MTVYEKLYGIYSRIKDTYFSVDSSKCIWSDRRYVCEYYYKRMGRKIDMKHPKLLSEKLNWLKVYYHDPLMTVCADKYRMRQYVKTVWLITLLVSGIRLLEITWICQNQEFGDNVIKNPKNGFVMFWQLINDINLCHNMCDLITVCIGDKRINDTINT